MGSTTRTTRIQLTGEPQPPPLRWRTWPLVDNPRWSWLAIVGILATAALIWWLGGGWLLSLAALAGLAATVWQFFLPVDYEIGSLGLRRRALSRTWLLPWHSVRSYQLKTSGILMFQRSDPSDADVLRSVFVPYPADEDELLVAVRQHLAHAAQLPQ